jgi:hypothetical protein
MEATYVVAPRFADVPVRLVSRGGVGSWKMEDACAVALWFADVPV